MHPIEAATIAKLKDASIDLTPYLNPVPFTPPALVGLISNAPEEVEEPEEDEED